MVSTNGKPRPRLVSSGSLTHNVRFARHAGMIARGEAQTEEDIEQ